jgi:hypothetical protein
MERIISTRPFRTGFQCENKGEICYSVYNEAQLSLNSNCDSKFERIRNV